MWNICFILSVSIVFLVLCFVILSKIFVNRKTINVNVFNWLITGIFLSAIVAFYPMYNDVFAQQDFGVFKTIILSLHNAIRLFVVDADYMFVLESVAGLEDGLNALYTSYMAILFIVSPIFTFGFILSFFKNLSSALKYYFSYFNDVYVFSELNEKSFALAKSIKENNLKRTIVFCGVLEDNDEKSAELIGEAEELGAICFKKDVFNVNFRFHSPKKGLYFFAIGTSKHENVNQALKLGEKYNDINNSRLYVFSDDIGSELLLSSINGGNMKVKRISEAQSLINRELYRNPGKLFANAVQDETGNKNVSAVIIGLGEYGMEMLKTLVWFGQMDGYKIKINAFDQNVSAEDEFAMQCPEILGSAYNRVLRAGEAYYDVTINSNVNVNTKEFIDKIKKIGDATYVFITLGSDERNIKTAVDLRTTFERMKIKPIIQTVVYNTGLATNLNEITNYRGQKYNIDFIGSLNDLYSEAVIVDSPLEEEALLRHLKWGSEQDFWKYEYNYRSSVASAIHLKARIACNIPGADKREEELTNDERDVIENLEHRRWNAYMRSQGYVYSGSKDKLSRNDLAKMHHDLVVFDELSEEEKRKDSRIGTK